MKLDSQAVERGKVESTRDIQQGSPKLFWGTKGSWGDFMVRLMADRFGVSIVHVGCFTTLEKESFEHGYNHATVAHVDATFGDGAFQAALDEVDAYRQRQYHAYLAKHSPNT
jgi:hypothetical protein